MFDQQTNDIMYVTSISTLVMLTALILAVVISYTSCKYAFFLFNGLFALATSRQPNQKPQNTGANGDTPRQNPMMAAISKALNMLKSKKKE